MFEACASSDRDSRIPRIEQYGLSYRHNRVTRETRDGQFAVCIIHCETIDESCNALKSPVEAPSLSGVDIRGRCGGNTEHC